MKNKKFVLTWGDIIFFAIIIIIILIFAFFKVKYIQTGSMEPTLKIGAIVVVDPNSEPKVNDIAMYKLSDGYVVHRIIDIQGKDYYFKGDNVSEPDAFNPIKYENVVGPVIIKINLFAPLVKWMHRI